MRGSGSLYGRCKIMKIVRDYGKLKNVETQLILYPRESHGIKEIPQQFDRLRRIVAWSIGI
jgi:hypothetical protein